MNTNMTLQPPPIKNGFKEYRVALDLLTLPFRMSLLKLTRLEDVGKGRTVFVLPGFGASDKTMLPLRYFLEQHGFQTYGWGLGTNKAGMDIKHDPNSVSWTFELPTPYKGEAGVPLLCDAMVKKVREFHAETRKRVVLVGWSLGGSIAREVARDLPDIVEHVVTLGSPLIGGPKYTAAASILASKGLNLDWIEKEVNKRNKILLKCKSTSIVSPSDGVVGFSASIVPDDDVTRYIELDVSHLGMGINHKTLTAVLTELRDD